MLRCRYVAVLDLHWRRSERDQYLAHRVARAEQLIVKFDFLLLVDTLQMIFKNVMRVGLACPVPLLRTDIFFGNFNQDEHRTASLLARPSCRVNMEDLPASARNTITGLK